ncbi:MAG TPA: MerR family transcriptional regulator [Minicystis sp.]|nr:MerR family transcriptional regulator [Minicystis sp.]
MVGANRYLRPRKRGRRKKRPPPEGVTVAELAAQVRITPRAVRYYVERGLLPAPEFRGSRTRYGKDHLARLFAIVAMRRERLDLDAIGRRLATLTPAELEAYLPAPPAPPPTPGALAPPPAPTYASVGWAHVALLPGVELLVREGASPAVRKIVQEIVDHCVGQSASTNTT